MNDLDALGANLLNTLGDFDVTAADDAALTAVATRMVKMRNAVDAVLCRLAAEIDRRGLARRQGAASTGQWFVSIGVAPHLAYRWVRDGIELRDLATVADDAADGGLSGEHVHAVVAGVRHVEARVNLDEVQRAKLISQLLAQAHTATPAQVSSKARAVAIELAPGVHREIPVAEDRSLNSTHIEVAGDGRVTGRFDMDSVIGEKLLAAINALSLPVPEYDGSPDERSPELRRADALETILDGYLKAEDTAPTAGGNLPHVTLTMIASAVGAAGVQTAEPASLAWTGPVSRPTAQLVGCDSVITAIITDGESVPLDVKRNERFVTPGIRKALIVRDQGCAFPGCHAAAGWTQAHHIVTWDDGGPTSLDNCVLLCQRHHTAIHHTEWEVKIGDDRHPWFTPPESIDPSRTPLRSQARRTLTTLPNAA